MGLGQQIGEAIFAKDEEIKRLRRVAEIAAVWREGIDETLHEFLQKNGWVRMKSGYWSHAEHGEEGTFPDDALGTEMDVALNELERTGGKSES